MFSRLDPLVDFRCPRCAVSLRFRRVEPDPTATDRSCWLCVCPYCHGRLVARRHPAFADNWRWMVFILPGVLCSAVGVFVPSAGWLLPWALGLLALGLVALVGYMVWQRWGWACYELPPP